MADLQRMEICIKEADNLNSVLVPALKEANMICHMELEGAEIEIKELTTQLNDAEAKNQQLRRKRIWWGVAGVAVGAVTYSLLK